MRFQRLCLCLGGIDLALAGSAFGHQILEPLFLFRRGAELGVVDLHLILRTIDVGLERPRVEFKEQLPLLHDVAVREVDLVEVPADPRSHFDRFDRLQPAVVLVEVDDLAHLRLGDGHFGRGRIGPRGRRAASD